MILLVGILTSILSKKLDIPNVLLLIISGMLLGKIQYQGVQLMSFPAEFLTSIAVLALVMIVFDGTSKFKIRDVDQVSVKVLKLVIVFIALNAILLTASTLLLFRFNSPSIILEICLALIFAFINSGTDPGTVLILLDGKVKQISKVLQVESVLNTPFMVLFPFIIIDLMERLKLENILAKLAEYFIPFIQQFVTGIGSGALIGIIFFKFMRKRYAEKLSPLAFITAALITYTLAENLGGNGVLAVTALGLFFGNVIVVQKDHLFEFSSLFAHALEILVFVFVGLIVELPLTLSFFLRSISLFIVYLAIRYAAIDLVFRKEFGFKEKLFMALNASKGIAVASIVFAITTLYADQTSPLFQLDGVVPLLNLTLAFMFYSIIVSTAAVKYSNLFLNIKQQK